MCLYSRGGGVWCRYIYDQSWAVNSRFSESDALAKKFAAASLCVSVLKKFLVLGIYAVVLYGGAGVFPSGILGCLQHLFGNIGYLRELF